MRRRGGRQALEGGGGGKKKEGGTRRRQGTKCPLVMLSTGVEGGGLWGVVFLLRRIQARQQQRGETGRLRWGSGEKRKGFIKIYAQHKKDFSGTFLECSSLCHSSGKAEFFWR